MYERRLSATITLFVLQPGTGLLRARPAHTGLATSSASGAYTKRSGEPERERERTMSYEPASGACKTVGGGWRRGGNKSEREGDAARHVDRRRRRARALSVSPHHQRHTGPTPPPAETASPSRSPPGTVRPHPRPSAATHAVILRLPRVT